MVPAGQQGADQRRAAHHEQEEHRVGIQRQWYSSSASWFAMTRLAVAARTPTPARTARCGRPRRSPQPGRLGSSALRASQLQPAAMASCGRAAADPIQTGPHAFLLRPRCADLSLLFGATPWRDRRRTLMVNSLRIAQLAATAAAVFWTAKATAIGIAGGLDKSPLESPLFIAGLSCGSWHRIDTRPEGSGPRPRPGSSRGCRPGRRLRGRALHGHRQPRRTDRWPALGPGRSWASGSVS